jgi:hypothetical protein
MKRIQNIILLYFFTQVVFLTIATSSGTVIQGAGGYPCVIEPWILALCPNRSLDPDRCESHGFTTEAGVGMTFIFRSYTCLDLDDKPTVNLNAFCTTCYPPLTNNPTQSIPTVTPTQNTLSPTAPLSTTSMPTMPTAHPSSMPTIPTIQPSKKLTIRPSTSPTDQFAALKNMPDLPCDEQGTTRMLDLAFTVKDDVEILIRVFRIAIRLGQVEFIPWIFGLCELGALLHSGFTAFRDKMIERFGCSEPLSYEHIKEAIHDINMLQFLAGFESEALECIAEVSGRRLASTFDIKLTNITIDSPVTSIELETKIRKVLGNRTEEADQLVGHHVNGSSPSQSPVLMPSTQLIPSSSGSQLNPMFLVFVSVFGLSV